MSRRSGLTVVHLLVVFAILLLCAGFFFPAIKKLRSNADKTVCSNNLKQLALSMHSYAATTGRLPDLTASGAVEGSANSYTGTIHFSLLPYLEYQAIYNDGISDKTEKSPYTPGAIVAGNKRPIASTVVKYFLCPIDRSAVQGLCQNQTSIHIATKDGHEAKTDSYAGTSYSANYMVFGSRYVNEWVDGIKKTPSGIYTGRHSALYKINEITDGTSNTIMFAERLVTMQTSFGSLWNYPNFDAEEAGGLTGEYSPSSLFNPFIGMGSVNGKAVGVFAPNTGWANYSMAPQYDIPQDTFDPSRAGSAHPHAVIVGMMDGSVRSCSCMNNKTWCAALTPDGNEVLEADFFE